MEMKKKSWTSRQKDTFQETQEREKTDEKRKKREIFTTSSMYKYLQYLQVPRCIVAVFVVVVKRWDVGKERHIDARTMHQTSFCVSIFLFLSVFLVFFPSFR